jgi:dCTP deaminase
MILSNVQLHEALDSGRLIIEPQPQPRLPSLGRDYCPYDTHSVDLRLGRQISEPKEDRPFSFDLTQRGNLAEFLRDNSTARTLSSQQPYVLAPGKFILGRTLEVVRLPIPADGETCLAARIEGKSSRARLGLLVHFTAPTVHPGWDGPLTLEMINLGPAKILLSPDVPIAQLIVEEVRGLPIPNPSQFQCQQGPEGAA